MQNAAGLPTTNHDNDLPRDQNIFESGAIVMPAEENEGSDVDIEDTDTTQFQNTWAVSGERFQLRSDPAKKRKRDLASRYFGEEDDFSYLSLKPDSKSRPLWVDPVKGVIILETFSPSAAPAGDFLTTIAEPQSRPTHLHEYALTLHSLYAAASVGLSSQDIVGTLNRFLKTELPSSVEKFIWSCTKSYGKVKLVLKNNAYFVESTDTDILQILLKDEVIGRMRVNDSDHKIISAVEAKATMAVIPGTTNAAGVQQANLQIDAQRVDGASVHDVLSNEGDDESELDDTYMVHRFGIP